MKKMKLGMALFRFKYAPVLFLLAVAGGAVWRLGWANEQNSGISEAPAVDPPDLDSFSRPSLAASILHNEADRLSAAWDTNGPGTAAISRATADLEDLEANVDRLRGDLEQKLLAAYTCQNRPDKFLDHYLDLLRKPPPDGSVVVFSSEAFDCACACGRTEELFDAVGHLCRFQPQRKDAARMRAQLDKWTARKPKPPNIAAR
jgi:hypothetical protein